MVRTFFLVGIRNFPLYKSTADLGGNCKVFKGQNCSRKDHPWRQLPWVTWVKSWAVKYGCIHRESPATVVLYTLYLIQIKQFSRFLGGGGEDSPWSVDQIAKPCPLALSSKHNCHPWQMPMDGRLPDLAVFCWNCHKSYRAFYWGRHIVWPVMLHSVTQESYLLIISKHNRVVISLSSQQKLSGSIFGTRSL